MYHRPLPMHNHQHNQRTRSPPKRERVNVLRNSKLWTLSVDINGTPTVAIIDSGATISVVNAKLVSEANLDQSQTFPIQVADGNTCYTMGATSLTVKFPDQNSFVQKCHVIKTQAFDAILGLDFLSGNPRCQGILTQPEPERLLFDYQQYPLTCTTRAGHQCFRLKKLGCGRNESYTLCEEKRRPLIPCKFPNGPPSTYSPTMPIFSMQNTAPHKTMPFGTIGRNFAKRMKATPKRCSGQIHHFPKWRRF